MILSLTIAALCDSVAYVIVSHSCLFYYKIMASFFFLCVCENVALCCLSPRATPIQRDPFVTSRPFG